MKRLFLAAAVGACLATAVSAFGTVQEVEACTYDPTSRTVTLDLRLIEGAKATLSRKGREPGSEIVFSSRGSEWIDQRACGTATDQNTDKVIVLGGGGGHLTISQRPRKGAKVDAPFTGIIFEIKLGASCCASLTIVGNRFSSNTIAAGTEGVSFQGTGTRDVTFVDPVPSIEFEGGFASDNITGQGGLGTGGATTTPLVIEGGGGTDDLTGGLGNDRIDQTPGHNSTLRGDHGNDKVTGDGTLDGGPGDDLLIGRAGDDVLIGGPGKDSLNGKVGSDTLLARDGEADTVNGGKFDGTDQAQVDASLDTVTNVEAILP